MHFLGVWGGMGKEKKKKKQKMSDEMFREEILEHMNEIEVSFFCFELKDPSRTFFFFKSFFF